MVFLYMAPCKERRPRGHAGDAVIVADHFQAVGLVSGIGLFENYSHLR
jgi:hypothetical protein